MCLQVGPERRRLPHLPALHPGGGYLFGTKPNGDYDPADLGVGKPESIAAFAKIRALGEQGEAHSSVPSRAGNSIATFTDKKCAYLVSGPWAITDIKTAGIAYDISPVPGFAGGKPAQPFVGVQAFYVPARARTRPWRRSSWPTT